MQGVFPIVRWGENCKSVFVHRAYRHRFIRLCAVENADPLKTSPVAEFG